MRTGAAKAAKAIKQELKKAFPTIQFSVKSQNYSMGCNVNATWTNGPTTKEVYKIIGKYQYGHFDGMIDLYEYSNDRPDIPQAKYIFANRDISDDIRNKAREKIAQDFGKPLEGFDNARIGNEWGSSFIGRVLSAKDLTNGWDNELNYNPS